jgi:hypothetical protein
MLLRLNDVDGSPRQFVHVESRTPTSAWPREGSRVVVLVARHHVPKVAVLWQFGVWHPAPPDGTIDESGALIVPGLAEADLQALHPIEPVDPDPTSLPSRLARRYLVPTEKFRGEWRRHWIRWVKQCAFGLAVALVLLSGYRVDVGRFVVDLGLIRSPETISQAVWGAWIAWLGLAWLNTRLVLTSRRVMLIKGVLWRRVASVPLAKAADILHTTSPLGALLRYGTFRFSNVPVLRPLWRVADVPSPRTVYLQIVGETFDPQPLELPYLPAEVEESLDGLMIAEAIA